MPITGKWISEVIDYVLCTCLEGKKDSVDYS